MAPKYGQIFLLNFSYVKKNNFNILRTKKPKFNEETLKLALKAIEEENLSYRNAAIRYNIPKSTLHEYKKKILPN
jgi:hypothetical protein